MTWSIDARIPVRLGSLGELGAGDAVLVQGAGEVGAGAVERFEPEPLAHAAACGCCAGRSAAAQALDRLFQRRARGEVGFFRRVLAVTSSEAGDLEVWSALRNDAVASARFRVEDRA